MTTILSAPAGPSLSIDSRGVVNDASYTAPVAPGSIAAAFGDFILSSPLSVTQSPQPTSIFGLSLQFGNGMPAPLFFVSGVQVDFQVPWDLGGQAQSALAATLSGQTSAAQIVSLAPFNSAAGYGLRRLASQGASRMKRDCLTVQRLMAGSIRLVELWWLRDPVEPLRSPV